MKDIQIDDLLKNLKLTSRKTEDQKTVVKVPTRGVGSIDIGGADFVIMAGPCSIESLPLTLEIAAHVKSAGAQMLRGGAYKPLTFPYRDEKIFELREKGLEILSEVKKQTGMPVVTEVVDVRDVFKVAEIADMLQIGARNMQNYALLLEVAKTQKPILLKRHFGASLRDWLGASEYVLKEGNPNVVLCERGIVAPHTHHPQSRFIVDLQVIPAAREYTHLPIVVDPSHATFRQRYVPSIARAACAAGADGILIDVHSRPFEAAVDSLQALTYAQFEQLAAELRKIRSVLNEIRTSY